jgi:hypothetical protein
MEINSIILRHGYVESNSTCVVVFQICRGFYESKLEAWNSFLKFLVEKYKYDCSWEKLEKRNCGHVYNERDKFCPECGKNLSKKNIKLNTLVSFIFKFFGSNCDDFGSSSDDLEEVDSWFPWESLKKIKDSIEIDQYAEEILPREMYRWAQENDTEFFTLLDPDDDWEMFDWLRKKINKELGI